MKTNNIKIDVLNEQDLRKNMISNIDQSINEYIEVEQIEYLTDKDIRRIKQEIINYLNSPEQYIFDIKEIYKTTLELIFLNKLDIIGDQDDLDSLNEFIGEYNLIVSVDKNKDIKDDDPIIDNLDVNVLCLYQDQDQGSLHNIRIPFLNPIEVLE